jgi:hypothetical protein
MFSDPLNKGEKLDELGKKAPQPCPWPGILGPCGLVRPMAAWEQAGSDLGFRIGPFAVGIRRETGETPSLTLAFPGLRFHRLRFNRPTPRKLQAIHTTTCRALI